MSGTGGFTMMRVFFFFLVVALLAAGAAWLAERPGEVMLTWQGWRIDTSVTVLIVALLALVIVLMFLWAVLRVIVGGPGALSSYFRARRREKGMRSLSQGMIAAAAGDRRRAVRYASEARKLMRGEPLTLLLQAQAAQLAGDQKAARKAFEAMLAEPDTELLGLRGLYIEAQRAGDETAARLYAHRAADRAPGLPWAANALVEFHTRDGDWQGALKAVERNAENRLIDAKAAKRARAVLLTAEAMAREEADPDGALELALEAHRLVPELVPAAVTAGRLSASNSDTRQATRIIEKTWRQAPHPELAGIYVHARPGDSARDRLKRARTLAAKRPGEPEGQIAVAAAAIEARDWAAAREALRPLLEPEPTRRVCLLMAEIEQSEHGDAGRLREWLARALRAPRGPTWVADGYVSDQWAPVSPVTGRLDAFEWKTPPEAIGARPAVPGETPVEQEIVIEAEAAVTSEQAQESPKAPEAPTAPSEAPPVPAASAEVKTDRQNPPAATEEAPPPAKETVKPAGRAKQGSSRPRGEPVALDELPRPPDDPGPEPEREEEVTPPRPPI